MLAVGDAEFQKKCLGKMSTVAHDGRTIIFVSHNMAAIQSLCTRAILLDSGRISFTGTPQEAIERYTANIKFENGNYDLRELTRSGGNGSAVIERLVVVDSKMRPVSAVRMGDMLGFEIHYKSQIPLDRADFVIAIYTSLMQRVCQLSSVRSGFMIKPTYRQGIIRCFLPEANFTSGRYYLNLAILDASRQECYDHLTQAGVFDILEADVFGSGKTPDPQGGPCFFIVEWQD